MSIAEKLTTIAENEQKVFDAGKQSEYDRFWDDFQNKGGTMSCAYIFSGGKNWSIDTYKPKYRFYPTYTAANMFQGATWLTDTLVPIDFTHSTFNNASMLFYGCTNLVTVNKIISKKEINWTSAFVNCNKLENITFEPQTIKKSSLITMPFNEAFYKEYPTQTIYYLNDSIYNAYSEYCAAGNVLCEGAPSNLLVTSVHLEDGTKVTLYQTTGNPLPDWFIPEDETQEVSFYLENPDRECIGNSINFSTSPLSKESITNIFKSLSSDVADKKLTLKKTAVNTAFNMDVDADESTWNYEYTMLVYARSNWTISYA